MALVNTIKSEISKAKEILTIKRLFLLLLGSCILSFGMYNIHRQVGITEGGVLGLVLLFNHLGFRSSIITPILDITCYSLGAKFLGFDFIKLSLITTFFMSCFFRIWEAFPPLIPDLSPYPLISAILGGLFIGVGVGIIISQGGSSGGDDALALILSKLLKVKLSFAYLFTDFTVLALSLIYIPFNKIIYSFVTVIISSNVIELIQKKVKNSPKVLN